MRFPSYIKVFSLMLPCLAFGTAAFAACPDKTGYEIVWEDDFDGDALNRDYWNVEVNGSGCGNAELQYYIDDKANVDVRDGNLVLTARRRDYEGKSFTSGRINTLGKVGFTYGIVEARIKFPKTADGLWPAFWMMGDDIKEKGWPVCGETDILEMGHANGIKHSEQDRLFNGALHWGVSPERHQQTVGDRTNSYSLQDGEYHTFTLLWTPERIEMYVDGCESPYLSVDIISDGEGNVGKYFHKDNFILFNLAVGGNFPGIHSADGITALPESGSAEMLVDYVRVYQNKMVDGSELSLNK